MAKFKNSDRQKITFHFKFQVFQVSTFIHFQKGILWRAIGIRFVFSFKKIISGKLHTDNGFTFWN